MRTALALLAVSYAAGAADVSGLASWYGEDHRGKTMANGRAFNPDRLTAASYRFPLGAFVVVESRKKRVRVEITDRGPNHRLKGRVIDLSAAAFRKLHDTRIGLLQVKCYRKEK